MKAYQRHDHGLRAGQARREAIAWRCRRLRDAGCPSVVATSAAADLRVDLHVLLQLVDRGCPPDLAIRLLDPLPNEMRA